MAGPTRSQPASGSTATRRAIPRAVSSASTRTRSSRIPSSSYSRQEGAPSGIAASKPSAVQRDFEHHGPSEKTNIHVVVRCRGRTEREVSEKSGMVVSTEGVKGQNVEVNMGPHAMGNKSYTFDRVFSPAADQSIVFDDVVIPILNETGTGKTYTMSGDMTDTLGILSDAAGIIPRVLYALFQKLDDRESSVKCSFLELYNEELRDLLSPEEGQKLKIYDDNSAKKGANTTMVQGMGETWIHDAHAGIKLLQEGSYKRQVASTRCNDLSSRSHTVFTITAYIKRTSEKGEEFVSSGKLNLVDLAGSENIGRSGAENKRATEAGLINKSLLTLGRVINALVDGTQHIPYRESKLTRLLQDSLGGHTKTCIIATVSPSKESLDETVSTLDYAFRAKNIRNKPQMNSTLSKKTMLREFTVEIEKLKAELIATRLRNGVYLPNDQFEEMTLESESRRILTEEQRAKIETMEVSLKNKVQELMNLTGNFNSLKKEHEATRKALESTEDILKQTDIVLQQTKKDLEEETMLRQAHESTENELRAIGKGLITELKGRGGDLEGLYEKINRKQLIHDTNREMWQSERGNVLAVSDAVDERMNEFQIQQSSVLKDFESRLEAFVSNELQRLDKSQGTVAVAENGFGKEVAGTKEETARCRDEMNEVVEGIKDLREDVKEKVNGGLSGLTVAAGRISKELITELVGFQGHLKKSYSDVGAEFKTAMEKVMSELEEQRGETQRLRKELKDANERARIAGEEANAKIRHMLEEERRTAELEKTALLGSIKELIDRQGEQRTSRIEANINGAWSQVDNANMGLQKAHSKYNASMNGVESRNDLTLQDARTSQGHISSELEKNAAIAEQKNIAMQNTARAVHAETERIVKTEMEGISTQMAALDEYVTRARSTNDGHHAERIERLDRLTSGIKQSFEDIRKMLSDFKQHTESFSGDVSQCTDGLKAPVEYVTREVRLRLRGMKEGIERAVMQEYQATGKTPVKRAGDGMWDSLTPGMLPKTGAKTELLAKVNGGQGIDSAEMTRIEEDDEGEAMAQAGRNFEDNTPVK
ncbi:kinesin motor protein cin8, partial [Ascosphaera atra]